MIRLEGVRKTFGSTVAVADLTLEIRDGEIVGLLGPNGAGKTTTINMLIGQVVPDAGRIRMNGPGSPTDLAARGRIGVAPQARMETNEFWTAGFWVTRMLPEVQLISPSFTQPSAWLWGPWRGGGNQWPSCPGGERFFGHGRGLKQPIDRVDASLGARLPSLPRRIPWLKTSAIA